jgi:DNA-binding Xre family transcriptional regulator
MGKVYLTLDKLLESRNMSRYELAKRTGIGYPIIDNYYKNKVVRYDSYVLERICTALNCTVSELVCYEK